jgi:hypothetical protein
MTLFYLTIKEYFGIVESLEKKYPPENDRMILDRGLFQQMLERNAYMTFSAKVNSFKAFNFLIHDKQSYTMPYKDPTTKKTVRKVMINYATYKTLKRLYETSVNL